MPLAFGGRQARRIANRAWFQNVGCRPTGSYAGNTAYRVRGLIPSGDGTASDAEVATGEPPYLQTMVSGISPMGFAAVSVTFAVVHVRFAVVTCTV
jgi:hypothetical protein